MGVVGQKSWSVTQCQGTREALGHQMMYLLVMTKPCLVSESRICHFCNCQMERVSLMKSRGHFPGVGFLSRPPGSQKMKCSHPVLSDRDQKEGWCATRTNYLDCSLEAGLGPKHPLRGTSLFSYQSEQTFNGPSWRTHILSIWGNFPVHFMASQMHLLLSVPVGHSSSVPMISQ